jgi:hypothetical protein
MVMVDVEDEPAYKSYRVLVTAPDKVTAKRLAKQGAVDEYDAHAGGWSSKPRAMNAYADEMPMPTAPSIILAAEQGL